MLAAQCLLRSILATLIIAFAHSFWCKCEQAKPQLVIFRNGKSQYGRQQDHTNDHLHIFSNYFFKSQY